MKLCYFNDFRLGVLKGDSVVDITDSVKDIPHRDSRDLILGLIERWDSYKAKVEKAAADGKGVPLKDVKLRPPVPRPGNIVCMAVNYMENGTLAKPAPALSLPPVYRLAIEAADRKDEVKVTAALAQTVPPTSPVDEPIQEIMQAAVSEAQRVVLREAPGSGTTLTAALVIGQQVTIAHVGDSRAYRQRSEETPELRAIDPENRLLARQSRLRLDAEIVRDVALAASPVLYGDTVILQCDELDKQSRLIAYM